MINFELNEHSEYKIKCLPLDFGVVSVLMGSGWTHFGAVR